MTPWSYFMISLMASSRPQVGKAAGPEQHRPVADLVLLLHLSDPAAEQLVLGRLFFLSLYQLRLRLGDEGGIPVDLGLRIGLICASVLAICWSSSSFRATAWLLSSARAPAWPGAPFSPRPGRWPHPSIHSRPPR